MDHGIIRLLPGYIYLRDWAFPFDSQALNMHIKGIVLPRDTIHFSELFNKHNPIMSWSMSSSRGQILWQLWNSIYQNFPQMQADDMSLITKGLLGFINGTFSSDTEQQRNNSAKLNNIERYIQSQLRGEISVDNLCDYFHVSRATLFRLFRKYGGLQHYIDTLRLERCYSELKASPAREVTVSEVAAGWGYIDPKSFNRKFRKKFGLPPSKILAIPVEETVQLQGICLDAGNNTPYQNFKKWLSQASGATDGENHPL